MYYTIFIFFSLHFFLCVRQKVVRSDTKNFFYAKEIVLFSIKKTKGIREKREKRAKGVRKERKNETCVLTLYQEMCLRVNYICTERK